MLLPESSDSFVNVKAALDAADTGSRRGMNGSFELWIDGIDNVPHRHHGWDKSEFGGAYTRCHVFKRPEWRIYGFKLHPVWSPRFELCVVAHSAPKHERETDEKILRRVTQLFAQVDVVKAVKALKRPSI